MKVIIIFFLILINKIFSELKTFELILLEDEEIVPEQLKIEDNSTFIIPKKTAVIPSLLIDYNNVSDLYYITLISTNINTTILLTSDDICDETKENLTITNSQFQFGVCGPYSATLTQRSQTSITQNIYLANKVNKNNCFIDYTAILSLQDLENIGMVILNYENQTLKLLEDNDTELIDNKTLNMKKCKHNNGKKFALRIDYILFGHEDETDDAFLAKNVSAIAYLDNLSTYSVFPYEYLNYFMTSFFSELNDECEKRQLNDTNIYFISCMKEKIWIHSIKRNLSLIIDNFSFSLSNLYNNTFSLIDEYRPELIYFNILFQEDTDDFLLGVDFFTDKEIAYNFLDNCTYIYYSKSINFTNDFSSNQSYFKIALYSLAGIAFSCLLILCTIYNCVFTKRITREFDEMQKDIIS